MERENLTKYDRIPESMINYKRYNGPHFSKKLCDFAVSKMKDKNGNITPYTREQVDTLLKTQGIELQNSQLYDYVYVANMCKADYLGSSIPDETHLARYIKDVIDDPDGYDGIVFNRWYADMSYIGIAIDWQEML
ncbi:MAG: hypothetical protein IJ180_07715 [Bacteroidales bacterium]|nr:hypothetical protein [Bacteroidales bacterium]